MNISLIENFLLTELNFYVKENSKLENIIVLLPHSIKYKFNLYFKEKMPFFQKNGVTHFYGCKLRFVHYENEILIYDKTNPKKHFTKLELK